MSLLSPTLAPLYGIGAAVCYGLTDLLAAKAARSVGPVTAAYFINLITLLVFAAIHAAFPDPRQGAVDATGLAFAATASVLIAVGLLAFFKALALGPVSLVSPISSAYPLVTTLLAIFAFGSQLPGLKLIGIVLVTSGVMVASGLSGSPAHDAHASSRGPRLALITAVCWGVGYSLMARSMDTLHWRLATLVEAAGIMVVLTALLPFVKSEGGLRVLSRWRSLGQGSVIAAGVLQLAALAALNVGLSLPSSAAVVTAISACYPIVTMALAVAYLHERPRTLALCGALASVAGVALLSL